jgi:putative Holliday junction resolvase
MSDSLPRTGRLAGIDYGTVRIGIAITDPAQSLASPLEILTRRDQAQDERYFRTLAASEKIAGFVVGLPVHTSGEESQKSHEARQFAKWLGEITSLPVSLFDERYTTAHAEELLQDAGLTSKRRKARRDMLAAQILLVAYLESGRSAAPPGGLEDR